MGSKTRAGFGAEEKGFRWGIFILLMVLYALFLNPRCWPEESEAVQESKVKSRKPDVQLFDSWTTRLLAQDSGFGIQDSGLQPSPFTLLTYRPNPYAESKLKLLALADPAPGPAPAGQAAGPEHADQVLLSVYDALNGALKANATLSGGSTNPTPHNADQVFLAIYDPTTGTIRINIVAGSITDPQLASAYSGVGACGANTWASTLSRNAAPTCTQPAISNLTATISSPLLLNSNTLSIQQANGSQSGYLLSGDWTTFNSKQAALTFNSPLQDSSNTISCPTCEATTNKNASNGYAGLSGGLLSASQLPAPTASTLGGIESLAQTTHQWINSISTTGAPAASRPACGDLSNAAASCSTDTTNASNITSGTLGAARLPMPTASTLGGVESLAQTSHQWVNSISTSGVPSASQPAASDLSNGVTGSGKVALQGVNTVSFSATPTFDASLGSTQAITLTGNVTSSTLSNCAAGEQITFDITEDSTGGRTFVWPTNVNGAGPIDITAGAYSIQSFTCDASGNARPISSLRTAFNSMPVYQFFDFINTYEGTYYGPIGSPSGQLSGGYDSVGQANHPGIWLMRTGTVINTGVNWTPTSQEGIIALQNAPAWTVEFLIYLSSISTVRVRFGIMSGLAQDPPTQGGYWIQYDSSVNGNWHSVTKVSTSVTDTDLGVAAAATTWTRLRVSGNAGTITFYVNGVLLATHTDNLVGSAMNIGVQAIALANSASVDASIDSVAFGRQVTR